jgi:malate dehydrogenase
MVASILRDKKMILPCSAYLEGEYGIDGLFVGVPIKLGRSGVEQVLELKLTEDELQALRRSADSVKTLLERLVQLGF